eukprot:m51a1_g6428 hypothetical protein (651) ;mRNA; f:332013-334187
MSPPALEDLKLPGAAIGLALAFVAVAAACAARALLGARRRPAAAAQSVAFTAQTPGGELVARALSAHGVRTLFTLCGGHIAPINVCSKRCGVRVVDVRNEATAVFAADATYRLTGVPGVAVLTAGPGLTNAATALMNARMSQSAVVVLGGATAAFLRGRGALQDVDQASVLRPCCKWTRTVLRAVDIAPAVAEAFERAAEGRPGPVFLEFPLEVLYARETLEENLAPTLRKAPAVVAWYLRWHVRRVFSAVGSVVRIPGPVAPRVARAPRSVVDKAARMIVSAEHPVLVVGSQTMLIPDPSRVAEHDAELVRAIETIGIPVYLSGMARGLLGRGHPLQMRQKRKDALRQSDVAVLAGSVLDFRMEYGLCFGRKTRVIAANRCPLELKLNRTPDVPVLADASAFLIDVATRVRELGLTPQHPRDAWLKVLRERDDAARSDMLHKAAAAPLDASSGLDPLLVCAALDDAVCHSTEGGRPAPIVIGDGGDFVATAAYSIEPAGPLSWLDPGPYGTLGCGAGFAIAASIARPGSDIWLLWGDGACGYGLADLDTMARLGAHVIAVVGNNGAWAQVQRDQARILGDSVACVLPKCDYGGVAQALGGHGVVVRDGDRVAVAKQFVAAAAMARETGKPVLVNTILSESDFRSGSISV